MPRYRLLWRASNEVGRVMADAGTNASGSLATLASCTIRPVTSTETVQKLDFLPAVKGLMGGRERGHSAGRTEPSRPLEPSAVLAPSRTLRAGAPRRGRCAASWTALARGALPIGRSGRKDVGFSRTEGWSLGQAAAGLA